MLRFLDLVIIVGFCSEPFKFFLALKVFTTLYVYGWGGFYLLVTRVARFVVTLRNPRVLSPRKIFVIL